METATHCACNLTRKLLLSERLVIVSSVPAPAQLLAVVLNGPGRDPNSAVWLTQPDSAPAMPRLFAVDVAYLDDQQKVIETAAVGPGTPFPPLAKHVASILFLADQSLARSGTVPGDSLKICTESELLVLLRALSGSEPAQMTDVLAVDSRSQPAEPFTASLIYLPSSGSLQPSEFFLPAEPPRAFESSSQSEQGSEAAQHDPEAAGEPVPIEPPQPPKEAGTQPGSQSHQLPQSLRAVIRRIDEQIRREGKKQPAFEGASKPEERPLTAPSAQRKSDDIPTALPRPAASPAQPQPEALTDLPTKNIPDFDELPAVVAEKPETPPQPQIGPEVVHARPTLELKPAVPSEPVETSKPAEVFPAIESVESPVESQPSSPAPSAREIERAVIARSKEKLSFATRVQRWLAGESIALSGNRRRGERMSLPGLVAFYWTGGAPTPYEIVNISRSGLYLRSKELWSPDTLVRMTLERQNAEREGKESISVLARVVRSDAFGVAHEFVMTEVLENLRVRDFIPEQGTNRKELEKFLAIH